MVQSGSNTRGFLAHLLLARRPCVDARADARSAVFNRDKDARILDRIEQLYMTDRGIRTLQHRLLIHARKSGLPS